MKVAPLKFQSRPYSSFDTIVQDLMRQVRSNILISRKYNYPTDRHKIEDWVDSYQADLCEKAGWLDYIDVGGDYPTGGTAPPKWIPAASLAKYGAKLVAGAASLLSWLGEGMTPVPSEKAQSRSVVCASCPKNRRAGLQDVFVRSTSEMIRRQIEFAHDVGLKTSNDGAIGICDACACPLRLMVHVPIQNKLSHLDKETYDSLDEKCWVRAEKEALAKEPSENEACRILQ